VLRGVNPSRWAPLAGGFTGLCCLGAAPVVTALSAAGLGLIVNDLILVPLLILFLGLTIRGLHRERGRHGRPGPERLGWVAAVASLGGLWVSGIVAGTGLALLLAASVWNVLLVRRATSRALVTPDPAS
jgi:hypothetical protein